MTDLDARAEAFKFARLLGAAPESLRFLERQPAEETRHFRESVSDSLFNTHRHGLSRLARLSRLLPAGITARLTETLLGSRLAARVAGEVAPEAAVNLAQRLSTGFLTDVSLELDPRRAKAVVAGMPPKVVVPVALELVARREFITMGRFVDSLSKDALAAVIGAIKSDETLLRVGVFVENKSRLDAIVRLLPEARLRGTVKAAREHALWPEALTLISHLRDDLKGRLGDLAAEQAPEALEELAQLAQRDGLWRAVLIAVAGMSTDNQRRLVNVPVLQRPEVLAGIISAAQESDLWDKLLPLVALMTHGQREQLLEQAMEQPGDVLEGMLKAATANDLVPTAIEMLAGLPVEMQRRLGRKAAQDHRELYAQARRAADSLGLAGALSEVDLGYREALGSR
jgi:uncharacterized protein YciI